MASKESLKFECALGFHNYTFTHPRLPDGVKVCSVCHLKGYSIDSDGEECWYDINKDYVVTHWKCSNGKEQYYAEYYE